MPLTTVSGWTKTSAVRQGRHVAASAIQKRRSRLRTGDHPGETLQRDQLLPQRQVLKNQFVMSTPGQRDAADDVKDHLQHAGNSAGVLYRESIASGSVLILANDRRARTAAGVR
jgi:hypothetical protein